jgi:hypothetical protein
MKKIVLILFACVSPSLFAQSFEAGISLGESVLGNSVLSPDVLTPGPGNISLKNGFRFGFRIGLNPYRYMGAEFGYAYSRSQLHLDGPPASEQGMAIHQGFADGLIHATKEGSRIRPFVAAGLNFSNFVPPGSSATSGGGQTKF